MSQAKVDRYKEEKKNRKKSWQKKKESVSLFFTICRASSGSCRVRHRDQDL